MLLGGGCQLGTRNFGLETLLSDYHDCVTLEYRILLRYLDALDSAVNASVNLVTHLHGFEDAYHVVGLHLLAHLNKDILDDAGQRGLDHMTTGSGGSGLAGSGLGCSGGSVAHGDTLNGGSGLGLLGQLNVIGDTVQLDVGDVALNVIDSNGILVTIDLIFIFLPE